MKLYDVAVIFAGGKSSRMGRDKALLPFGKDKTLAAFQHEKLQTLFKTVYISTKEEKFDFDAKLVMDCYKESSPLVGLLSVFETLDAEEVFVLSVDAPFVDTETIEYIMKADIEGYDAVVAKGPNGLEPLCGRYKKSILPLLRKHYNEENHRLQNLLDVAKIDILDFKNATPFTNLNYPKEYEEALKRSI